MIRTFNEYHLGDNLIHLNYLRKLGLPATHYCHQHYHDQLLPLIEDTDIVLIDLPAKPADAINAWIGANNTFQTRPPGTTWSEFYTYWFSKMSEQLNVDNPIKNKDDFLFDYPELQRKEYPQYDYLIINSVPMSGQLPDYNPWFFEKLIKKYLEEGSTVITTLPTGQCQSTIELNMSVTDIGALAKSCKAITAVETGPLWTTYNPYAKHPARTVFTQTHTIDLLNTTTYPNLPNM